MIQTILNKRVNKVDKAIGIKLYLLRRERGLSQQKLADVLSVSVQQIQKYEKGSNRISAGNLGILAKALGVEVSYFYHVESLLDFVEKIKVPNEDLHLEAVDNFRRIKDIECQKALNLIMKNLRGNCIA